MSVVPARDSRQFDSAGLTCRYPFCPLSLAGIGLSLLGTLATPSDLQSLDRIEPGTVLLQSPATPPIGSVVALGARNSCPLGEIKEAAPVFRRLPFDGLEHAEPQFAHRHDVIGREHIAQISPQSVCLGHGLRLTAAGRVPAKAVFADPVRKHRFADDGRIAQAAAAVAVPDVPRRVRSLVACRDREAAMPAHRALTFKLPGLALVRRELVSGRYVLLAATDGLLPASHVSAPAGGCASTQNVPHHYDWAWSMPFTGRLRQVPGQRFPRWPGAYFFWVYPSALWYVPYNSCTMRCMKEVPTDELRATFRDTLNEVEYQGERIVVLRYGKPTAVIVPLAWFARAEAALEQVSREEH